MFVYLTSGARVELPHAENVTHEAEKVSFFDGSGGIIAIFVRKDVVMYSRHDLGEALTRTEEAQGA